MMPEDNHLDEALIHIRKCKSVDDLYTISAVALTKWALEETKLCLKNSSIQLDEAEVKKIADAAAERLTYTLDLTVKEQVEYAAKRNGILIIEDERE